MAQADIAAWAGQIKRLGLLKDRGEGDLDWIHIGATDGSILEVRRADTYTRVVWSEKNPPRTPFAFWFLGSKNYPDFPKTDFIGTTIPPEYLNAEEVFDRLELGPCD